MNKDLVIQWLLKQGLEPRGPYTLAYIPRPSPMGGGKGGWVHRASPINDCQPQIAIFKYWHITYPYYICKAVDLGDINSLGFKGNLSVLVSQAGITTSCTSV